MSEAQPPTSGPPRALLGGSRNLWTYLALGAGVIALAVVLFLVLRPDDSEPAADDHSEAQTTTEQTTTEETTTEETTTEETTTEETTTTTPEDELQRVNVVFRERRGRRRGRPGGRRRGRARSAHRRVPTWRTRFTSMGTTSSPTWRRASPAGSPSPRTAGRVRDRAGGARHPGRGAARQPVTQVSLPLAHGLGGVRDLPVPLWLFYYGGRARPRPLVRRPLGALEAAAPRPGQPRPAASCRAGARPPEHLRSGSWRARSPSRSSSWSRSRPGSATPRPRRTSRLGSCSSSSGSACRRSASSSGTSGRC